MVDGNRDTKEKNRRSYKLSKTTLLNVNVNLLYNMSVKAQ